MHDQPNPDRAVLGILLDRDAQRPWSESEIEREIGSSTADCLNMLHGAGLIHRLCGFVWATRAALVSDEIGA
jgi:hypothetical protein